MLVLKRVLKAPYLQIFQKKAGPKRPAPHPSCIIHASLYRPGWYIEELFRGKGMIEFFFKGAAQPDDFIFKKIRLGAEVLINLGHMEPEYPGR